MRRAKGPNGERLFTMLDFLTPSQVSAFFSRLAAKFRQLTVQLYSSTASTVQEEDITAVNEEQNFSSARQLVMDTLHITHPLVIDQFDVCAMYKAGFPLLHPLGPTCDQFLAQCQTFQRCISSVLR